MFAADISTCLASIGDLPQGLRLLAIDAPYTQTPSVCKQCSFRTYGQPLLHEMAAAARPLKPSLYRITIYCQPPVAHFGPARALDGAGEIGKSTSTAVPGSASSTRTSPPSRHTRPC